jgi:predicted nucleic acid-binding protein
MKIIVDTNIVFSALLNSNSHIGQLLLDSRNYFEFYSCKYLQKELFNHFHKIRAYTKLCDKGCGCDFVGGTKSFGYIRSQIQD